MVWDTVQCSVVHGLALCYLSPNTGTCVARSPQHLTSISLLSHMNDLHSGTTPTSAISLVPTTSLNSRNVVFVPVFLQVSRRIRVWKPALGAATQMGWRRTVHCVSAHSNGRDGGREGNSWTVNVVGLRRKLSETIIWHFHAEWERVSMVNITSSAVISDLSSWFFELYLLRFFIENKSWMIGAHSVWSSPFIPDFSNE